MILCPKIDHFYDSGPKLVLYVRIVAVNFEMYAGVKLLIEKEIYKLFDTFVLFRVPLKSIIDVFSIFKNISKTFLLEKIL